MTSLPSAARKILSEGTLCYLAAPSAVGPHVTPVVFVLDGGRVWGTTGRGTTKAKLWRREPVAGGLVGWNGRWLTFRGPVTLYDALDPGTWPASVLRGPWVASASFRFSIKNARFFAGYARDATRLPLAWTPPARVVFSVDVESGALLDGDGVLDSWGAWGSEVEGSDTFRHAKPELATDDLPEEVRSLLDDPGPATLALSGSGGPAVLPAQLSAVSGELLARLPVKLLNLAGPIIPGLASLVVDRASAWRAAKMRGVMLRGPASAYVASEVRSGRAALAAAVKGLTEDDAALRLLPRTAVWWRGWASGTVRRP